MRKHLILIVLLVPCSLFGQNAWDAFRYSQLSYQGTARSMAFGNAGTALGGDFGSLSLNPAASALYPYAEITFTPALTTEFSQVNYFGQPDSEKYNKLGVSELGFVGSRNTSNSRGLVSFSYALGYNKVQDFTQLTSVRYNGSNTSWLTPVATLTDGIPSHKLEQTTDGYNPYYDSNAPWRSILAWNTYLLDLVPGTDDQYIAGTENLDEEQKEIYVGGLLDQRFLKESKGSMGDYLLNMGFNFNDRIFVGTSLTFRNIYYRTYEKFTETAQNAREFQTGFSSFSHTYSQITTGSGFNVKLGVIALLVDNLRLGLSVTTPTWTSRTDEWQEKMSAQFLDGKEYADSPYGTYSYKVRTPWRYNAGLSYVFGNVGLITLDYEGVDYTTMHMAAYHDRTVFEDENRDIRNGSSAYQFKMSHIFRAGAEVRIASLIALRGGYSFYSAGEEGLPDTHMVSGGLGIRGKQFFADLGASYRLKQSEYFSLYDIEGQPAPGINTLSRLRVALTLGFRY